MMIRFYTGPKGEAYKRLIGFLIERTDKFVLSEWDEHYGMVKLYTEVMDKLKPFLVEQNTMEQMQAKSGANYSPGTYYIYQCCAEAGAVLKEAVHGLYDWQQPHMPEDLCFWDAEGADYLYSVSHEKICSLKMSEEEARQLAERIPGLFMEFEAHWDVDCFINDAIKHQTDSLTLTSYRLTEIPDRIRELKQLKFLEVFEQDITRLPLALFELATLETLTLMTADLECIPPEIAKLQQLKHLTIYCGSSDRTMPGWSPKAKSDLLLDRLPPELGQLKQLETLNISYTGIQELPPELEQLTGLRYLSISNNLIKTNPRFLSRMPNLKYVDGLE
ncbi:leucine-rich repeat domain-containing protein [Paenibacillus sp. 19GGS1-52]|uniref:leucine-rich repeat domain-containing protein n=1 Tax=Paenibacillus sp. 19GGS1-52 TaxID=2758563 RepID=UPI001EFA8FF9|nr:leucine-rich repeat domain-containing protein [Paenibacillus sp. 19GGS1-52]ULO05612.1 leucine-rich repeat domain-containing protein [Paenibacillus sp. 19GGS1-52]